MSKQDFWLVFLTLSFGVLVFEVVIWAVGVSWYIALCLSLAPLVASLLATYLFKTEKK